MSDADGTAGNASTAMRPRICLLAEDQAFLATLLEVEFDDAGFKVAGPFKRVGDALGWLESGEVDVAVIDTVLADGPSTQLALALKDRGVRFVVHSGSNPEPANADPAFSGAPWLIKPILAGLVVQEVQRLLATP